MWKHKTLPMNTVRGKKVRWGRREGQCKAAHHMTAGLGVPRHCGLKWFCGRKRGGFLCLYCPVSCGIRARVTPGYELHSTSRPHHRGTVGRGQEAECQRQVKSVPGLQTQSRNTNSAAMGRAVIPPQIHMLSPNLQGLRVHLYWEIVFKEVIKLKGGPLGGPWSHWTGVLVKGD